MSTHLRGALLSKEPDRQLAEIEMKGLRQITKTWLPLLAVGLTLLGMIPLNAEPNEQASNSEQGPLDGKSFTGALGPAGKPKDTEDRFVFANGTFVSKECELRCKYPARPYYIRTVGDRIDFVSETKCPYKDAKIIWRGTVEGDRITGVSTWTVKRWYWTVEKTFEFSGKLEQSATPVASAD